MDITSIRGYTLKNLSQINIILGKNGSGKSTLLRNIEKALSSDQEIYGKTKYITPERGGTLVFQAGIEQNLISDVNWLQGQRRKNQSDSFRQQTVALYRQLEILVLREFENDQSRTKFEPYIGTVAQ